VIDAGGINHVPTITVAYYTVSVVMNDALVRRAVDCPLTHAFGGHGVPTLRHFAYQRESVYP